MKSKKHLQLFQKVFKDSSFQNTPEVSRSLDRDFQQIQQKEYLTNLNYEWLLSHPKLHIVPESDIEKYVRIQLLESKKEKRHIKIIKQLCHIINEEFVAITAGDKNNLFTQSWYFKTTKNYYYIIEKNHIVTMYNSFTKEIVTQGRLVANKTDNCLISNFISKIFA
jgi:hypothetical protein